MMKRASASSIILLLIISGLAFQLVWYGLLWSQMLTHPAESRPSDFQIFYSAGRIAREGHPSQVFNLQVQLEIQRKLLGYALPLSKLLPFNHPPLLVPILQLISTQDYMASYWRWVLVMLCFIAATMAVINQLLQALQWDRSSRGMFILCSVFFYPIFVGLLKGQDTAFLLLGAMFWFYGMVKKKNPVAGLGLAMTIIRPQIAIMLAVPFLFNRRGVWWWFCGGAAFLALYSFALVRFEGVRDFFLLLQISAKGQGFGMNQNLMDNFTGMVLRLLPNANIGTVHIAAWVLFLAVIIGLSVLWKVTPEIRYRHIVLAVTLSLFAAPHLHSHDLALLLIPFIALSIVLVSASRLKVRSAAAWLVLASVVWMFGEVWDPFRFTFPYLLMIGLPALTWFYETH
jgi:hypothetical protein